MSSLQTLDQLLAARSTELTTRCDTATFPNQTNRRAITQSVDHP
jgi:hypothetical protein